MNETHLNTLRNIFPEPPQQGPVGLSPAAFLRELPDPYFLQGVDENEILQRNQLRDICSDTRNSDLALYAAIMAWGGRNMKNYRLTLEKSSRTPLIELIQYLRNADDTREEAFKQAHAKCKRIQGLGISFFTKLMHFLRPKPDAYILDQFTAKSIFLLCPQSGIRITGAGMPYPQTTHTHYEAFCQCIEAMADRLGVQWTPDAVEQALFGKGSYWRDYLALAFSKDNFLPPPPPGTSASPRPPRPLEPPADTEGDARIRLANRIARAHRNALNKGRHLPDNGHLNITSTAPFRVHCDARNGAQWQYAINFKCVHAELFLNPNRRGDYNIYCAINDIVAGHFEPNIQGTPHNNEGQSASVKSTINAGANAPEAEWDAIAAKTISLMETLYARLSNVF